MVSKTAVRFDLMIECHVQETLKVVLAGNCYVDA